MRTGIYHGTEPLCPCKDTGQVEAANSRWKNKLDYDLYVPDIPRSARLCVSLCAVSRKGKKVSSYLVYNSTTSMYFYYACKL